MTLEMKSICINDRIKKYILDLFLKCTHVKTLYTYMFVTYLSSKKSNKYFLKHLICYFQESTLNQLEASSLFSKVS